jgi:pilus assembly protein Flp/PilA
MEVGNPFTEKAMLNLIRRFSGDESGATAVEYGIMVALIAVIIIVAVTTLGTTIRDVFNDARLRGLNAQ